MPYDRLWLYHDPKDPRLVVPKRNPASGWTVNVDHRYGPSPLAALGAFVFACVAVAVLLSR